LLDHYVGAGDEKRTAELAAQLEQIHTERGNLTAAERFTDLRRRFEKAARTTEAAATTKTPAKKESPVREFSVEPKPEPEEADQPAATAPVEAEEIEVVEAPAQPTAQSAVHELDLSEEWAALATELDGEPEKAPAGAAESVNSSGTHEPAVPEFAALGDRTPSLEKPVKPSPSRGASNEADFTLELETPPVADEQPQSEPTNAQDFLEALSSDLDAALPSLKEGLGEGHVSNSRPGAHEVLESGSPSSQTSDKQTSPLSEIFDQFRSEVGEIGAEDEDLETHYNLGIAYREMGLIEEAISEFQKVAKGSSKGQAFRYAMQCCTLLGLAFMEKGQPAIAATWYERALAMPGLDQETILALRYDLGVAQELAGDMAAARKSFSQVYGMNIDYRDVAERLSSLGNER
jgi:tetratricopeptide (TPR) repeat protein